MTIFLAEHSGYCYGVKRAIKMLDGLVDLNVPVFTYGPIIHNQQVTDYYKQKGVNVIDDLEAFEHFGREIAILVIRSHGAPKAIYDIAEELGFEIRDATCPYVKKIQNTVSTYALKGYNIIIVGDSAHPEVIGINGWCNNSAVIVNTIEDVDLLQGISGPVCVVAQTTYKIRLWECITERLQNKYENCHIHNTICLATEQRQTACVEMAQKVELMIVIGGKHSSNTVKLAQLCSQIVKTIHIETKDDLDESQFKGNEIIGITAGASTPDWIIESVILKIEK